MRKASLVFILSAIISSHHTVATAADPKATGDVMGRDLSIPGVRLAGHVGLWSGARVIEALNDPTRSIQSNTLSSFKSANRYWGSRYWTNVSATNLVKTVNTASGQMTYGSSYTYTPFIRPTINRKPSSFRCDSLVAYSYYKGAGKSYPNIDPFINSFGSAPAVIYKFTAPGDIFGGAR